jgi:hypothetical protein
MVYCDKCSKCELKDIFLEPECEYAKQFYRKYGTSYIFPCGAAYNPEYLKSADHFEVASTSDCMLSPRR